MDSNTRLTYWKGTVAFLVLHSQSNTSLFMYGAALLDTLNATSQEYINIFLCGLKEVFVLSKSLTLGQHILIGNLNYKNIKQFVFIFFKLFFKDLGLKCI